MAKSNEKDLKEQDGKQKETVEKKAKKQDRR